jgi:MFS family permease
LSTIQTNKLWTKDFVFITSASTGIVFCNYFLFTTLPILAQRLTGTEAYSGLMMGVFTLAALAIRPFSGILSDKYGRVISLIAGAALSVVACLLYNFAAGLIVLLVFRVVHGIGFGIHSTSAGAVAGDVIPKTRLSEGIGYYGLSAPFATAVAPVIALSIIGSGEIANFRLLFILGAVISLASLVFDCFITYERKNRLPRPQTEQPDDPTEPAPVAAVLPRTYLGFESGVFFPAAVLILMYIGVGSVISFLSLFALERNLGNIGLFFTFSAAGMLATRLFLVKIADKRGADIVVIPGLALLTVCLALIPFMHTYWQVVALGFPFGLIQGAVAPCMNSLFFKRTSPQRKGPAYAAYASSLDIGYAIGSIAYGVIAAASNYYVVYIIAASFVILALILYIFTLARRTHTPPEPADSRQS